MSRRMSGLKRRCYEPFKTGWALFEEGGERFLMIGGGVRQRLHRRRHFHDGLEAARLASRIRRLVMRSTSGGWRQMRAASARASSISFSGGNKLGHQPPGERRLRIDGVGGEEQFRGARLRR